MNSAEDISKYEHHNNNYYWPISGNVANHSSFHKSPKKDRKWSFGSLFRRKKKNDSDSSSDDDYKKKKKSGKRTSKTNNPCGFDHIVIPTNSITKYNNKGVVSEPDYKVINNFIPASEITRSSRKCKRDAVKARAEARIRDNSRGDSSEEDSPFRSDESSASSSNRRTRAARTQRYLRRHSKDGETPIKSDELWKPHSILTGLSTIPPSHRTVASNKASSFCDYDNKNRLLVTNNQRSISYDGNIHHSTRIPSTEALVIHAHLPLGFPTNMWGHRIRAPPPPPPRDPNRTANIPNGENRPISYSFDHKTNSDQYLHRMNPKVTSNRSISEDYLVQLNEPQSYSRPLSTISKLSDYQYLTDKNPRSRKPICVMQPNSFDYWRQREENVTRRSPVIFTAKTHVTTSIFPQPQNPENIVQRTEQNAASNHNNTCINNTQEPDIAKSYSAPFQALENEPRKSTNLEEALDELEAIYKSLHLGDDDLLDRAAERESLLKDSSKPKIKIEPDPKSDDMAYRKFHKDRNNSGSESLSTGSYLLASPVFGGSFEEFHKNSTTKEPNTTFDDVVYRNVKHTNNILKVVEPQPPFGIPVGPVLPSTNSDYLHAAPINHKKSKKVPDIVKDDLAYRNLRKDANKEPALPQAHVSREDYLNNNNYKKKRAVRSLSANIYNVMHQNQRVKVFDTTEADQNIDDVADALQIARQILKDKEDKINATRKAFMSDSELKNNKFGSPKSGRHRLHVRNDDYSYFNSKPPRSPKGSTPIRTSSPDEDLELEKALQHSTLEELLTSLARETTEHLNKFDEPYYDLKKMSNNPKNEDASDRCSEVTPTPIDTKHIVVETGGSLVITPDADEDEHDYVNIDSNREEEFAEYDVKKEVDLNSLKNVASDKIGGEECVNVKYIALPTNGCTYINKSYLEFNNFSSSSTIDDRLDANDSVFNELTNSLTRLVKTSLEVELNTQGNVMTNTSEKLVDESDLHFLNGKNSYPVECINNDLSLNESSSVNKVEDLHNSQLDIRSDMNIDTLNVDNIQSNIVEFKLGPCNSENQEISHIDSNFDSLKSPKLVQNINSGCSNQDELKSTAQTNSNCVISNHTWYDDPSVIAIACSCGIACSYQLPFDIIAALGLIFAVISMLLAVITRI